MFAAFRLLVLASACIVMAGCSAAYQEAGLALDAVPEPAGTSGETYFVEFRAVMPVYPGHSYFVHGRLGADGNPVSTSEPIGFYPLLGPIGGSTLGLIAIPGLTTPDPSDATKRTVEKYRVALDKSRHDKLLAFVKKWRSGGEAWSLIFNNCNDFIAGAARSVGLDAPVGLALMAPYRHIRKLRELNS